MYPANFGRMHTSNFCYRQAVVADIPAIQQVRHAVRENRLSNPALITDKMVAQYMFERGKGWVATHGNTLAGFAIADLVADNIWALFVAPAYEGRGVGSTLQQLMLDWYFLQGKKWVWLGTAPGTRAAAFYLHTGWVHSGMHEKNEMKFELTAKQWQNLRR
jgi:GNAT superfamily N-acetyltransferase